MFPEATELAEKAANYLQRPVTPGLVDAITQRFHAAPQAPPDLLEVVEFTRWNLYWGNDFSDHVSPRDRRSQDLYKHPRHGRALLQRVHGYRWECRHERSGALLCSGESRHSARAKIEAKWSGERWHSTELPFNFDPDLVLQRWREASMWSQGN